MRIGDLHFPVAASATLALGILVCSCDEAPSHSTAQTLTGHWRRVSVSVDDGIKNTPSPGPVTAEVYISNVDSITGVGKFIGVYDGTEVQSTYSIFSQNREKGEVTIRLENATLNEELAKLAKIGGEMSKERTITLTDNGHHMRSEQTFEIETVNIRGKNIEEYEFIDSSVAPPETGQIGSPKSLVVDNARHIANHHLTSLSRAVDAHLEALGRVREHTRHTLDTVYAYAKSPQVASALQNGSMSQATYYDNLSEFYDLWIKDVASQRGRLLDNADVKQIETLNSAAKIESDNDARENLLAALGSCVKTSQLLEEFSWKLGGINEQMLALKRMDERSAALEEELRARAGAIKGLVEKR